ncbi:MAG: replicative DNA helicase [Oscillospiraceae bacterium]|jgi:replicative DNA helicase|nr:replicative DNA helicase [Oscillospiraceae bacterium]
MPFDFTQQQLPYSEEAEKTILGAILKSPDVFVVVLEKIKPDSFYLDAHKNLFMIMFEQFTFNSKIDIITVMNEAVKLGVFETDTEARRYLAAIVEGVPSVANIESYCKIVSEYFQLRQLVLISQEISETAMAATDSAEEILDLAEQRLYDLRQGKDIGGLVHLKEALFRAYEEISQRSGDDRDMYLGASTGYSNLDTVITGLNKSDLIILAARPGMGKTSFALNIMTNAAKTMGKNIVLFSLEMSTEQIATRIFSSTALIDSMTMRNGNIKQDEDWDRLRETMEYLGDFPIYLDDSGAITVPQIKAKLRRMKDLGLVVIDYLGLLSSTMKNANTVTILSDMTRQLKLMAKDLNVPVIVLSQLSRAVENRQDKRPMLSDLRDSGSIEQDADVVLFLYRDGYYNANSPDPNLVECIVSKNRHGETGVVYLHWDGQFTRFSMPTQIPPPFI